MLNKNKFDAFKNFLKFKFVIFIFDNLKNCL